MARRLEIKIEQLRNKIASQLIELSRYSDVINRRKIERDGLRVEVVGPSVIIPSPMAPLLMVIIMPMPVVCIGLTIVHVSYKMVGAGRHCC